MLLKHIIILIYKYIEFDFITVKKINKYICIYKVHKYPKNCIQLINNNNNNLYISIK